MGGGGGGKNKGKKYFQKGNIILLFHTKTMLMVVYKVNHPMCYKIILAEIFLDSLMSAV